MSLRFRSVKVAPGIRYTPTQKDMNVLGQVFLFPFKFLFWSYKMLFVGLYRLVKLVVSKENK